MGNVGQCFRGSRQVLWLLPVEVDELVGGNEGLRNLKNKNVQKKQTNFKKLAISWVSIQSD